MQCDGRFSAERKDLRDYKLEGICFLCGGPHFISSRISISYLYPPNFKKKKNRKTQGRAETTM